MYNKKREISILGCGWYGLELARNLVENGYLVKGSSTTAEKFPKLKALAIHPFLISFQDKEETFDMDFFQSPILVICIPPKRSSAEQHLFLSKIERIAEAANQGNVKKVIFVSSTSVYGDLNEEVNEHHHPIPDSDSGKAILAAEELLKGNLKFSTSIVRFGGLIGPERDPGRFFAGKSGVPNGQAPVNLIHLRDCIGITMKILEKDAFGFTFNACADDHPSRAVFYTQAAKISGLPVPDFKDELLNWKLIKSVTIKEQLNYNFKILLNSLVAQ